MKYFLCPVIFFMLMVSCSTVVKPVTPPLISEPVLIMGRGNIPVNSLAFFLIKQNPKLNLFYAAGIARIYTEEAALEGVNGDVAFSQMCLETGYLKFGGTVTPDQNNFCGLGTVSGDVPGERFETIRDGIRAHIQHLKAYGSTLDLVNPCIDRRFHYVKRGIAPTIFDLAGRWAANPEYGGILKSILERLYDYDKSVRHITLPRQGPGSILIFVVPH
ncbi:MAG: glucosaminidase domain-containing protein [Spirochaetales bacterium]|nr:glucosaminidase domain-containing protein [Spirochaetales bacterium]